MINQSKSDVIADILRQHGTLPVSRIVQEMQLRGMEAKPNNVRSLMSSSFKRFTSLRPGLWQLQDPSLSHAERESWHITNPGASRYRPKQWAIFMLTSPGLLVCHLKSVRYPPVLWNVKILSKC